MFLKKQDVYIHTPHIDIFNIYCIIENDQYDFSFLLKSMYITVTAGHFSPFIAVRGGGPINLNCHKCTTYKKLLEYVPLILLDKWYQCANESLRAEQYIILHVLSNTSWGIALHTSPWCQDTASQWEAEALVFRNYRRNEFATFLRDKWQLVLPNSLV